MEAFFNLFRQSFFPGLCCCLCFLPVLRGLEVEPITSLRRLRAMSPAEAAQGLPIDVTGVITYSEVGRNITFIQNEDGAAYVNILVKDGKISGRPWQKLNAGDRVRLRGVSAPGGFAPSIWYPSDGNVNITRLGKAPLPEPMRLFPTVIVDPPLDNYRVEVTGVVTAVQEVEGRTVVSINDGFDSYDLLIKGPPVTERLPADLIGSRIRAQGVFGSLTNDNRELVHARFFIPSVEDIEVVEQGANSVFQKDPVSYEALTSYQVVTGERLHLRGIVTAAFPPTQLFLRLEDGPLEVRTNQKTLPPVGTFLGVAGYRGIENGWPYLHTVALRVVSQKVEPEPFSLPAGTRLSDLRHGELISIEGIVQDTLVSPQRSILLLENGFERFTAELPTLSGQAETSWPVGSQVRITGILLQPEEEGGDEGPRLFLRDREDITMIRRPPFWTGSRIVYAITGLILASGGFAIWSFWLKHQVRVQARLLVRKMEAEKVQAERTRISQDLHDTLEQDLAAVNMQLNLARETFPDRPEVASRSLENARRILQRTRMESRHSIQELREKDFGDPRIGTLLEHLVQRFQMDSGTIIDYVPPPPFDLPAEQRRNVQLILREALHNAIQHANASQLVLAGERRGRDCLLEVKDNGRGFDTESIPSGRFGLKGLHERAKQLDAHLEICSTRHQGTRILLTLKACYPRDST